MTSRVGLSLVFWGLAVFGLAMYSLRLNVGISVVFAVPVAVLTFPRNRPRTCKEPSRFFGYQTSNTMRIGHGFERIVRAGWPSCVVAAILLCSQCVYGFARGETAIVTLMGVQLWSLAANRLPARFRTLALAAVLGAALYIALYPACAPLFELALCGLPSGNVLIDTQTGRIGITYAPGMRYEWSGPNTGLIQRYAPQLEPVWRARPIGYRALVAERSVLFRPQFESVLQCLPHDEARRRVVNAIATDANCARWHQAMLLLCLNVAHEQRLADSEALWQAHAHCFAIGRDPHEAAKAVYGWRLACRAWLQSIGAPGEPPSQAQQLARRAATNAWLAEARGEYSSAPEHMHRFCAAYWDLIGEYGLVGSSGSSWANLEVQRCPAIRALWAAGR